jgi:hypothetical protein
MNERSSFFDFKDLQPNQIHNSVSVVCVIEQLKTFARLNQNFVNQVILPPLNRSGTDALATGLGPLQQGSERSPRVAKIFPESSFEGGKSVTSIDVNRRPVMFYRNLFLSQP